MFSDRFWIVKLIAALALLAAFSLWSRRDHDSRFIELNRSAYPPESRRGALVRFFAYPVQTVDASGFTLATGSGPIHVATPQPPPVGSRVSAQAHLEGPRRLVADTIQIHEGYDWKRPLNYLVSILVVLVYFWVIRKRFSWTPADGVFRSRY